MPKQPEKDSSLSSHDRGCERGVLSVVIVVIVVMLLVYSDVLRGGWLPAMKDRESELVSSIDDFMLRGFAAKVQKV
jgi:hypothetical protein